jgi:GntR family transcriptional repressor for pyruvate dehydrogenase complex
LFLLATESAFFIDDVKQATMVEMIARRLIRNIVEEGLVQGDKMPSEREMSEQLGVSRLPLREAICMLKGMGLLETRHGKGIFVRDLDLAAVYGMLSPLLKLDRVGVDQIFSVRIPLETAMAEHAARYRTPEHLAVMKVAINGMKERLYDRIVYHRNDTAFHVAVSEATGNPAFRVMMMSIVGLVAQLQYRYMDDVEYRAAALIEHERIFEAIREQDSREAREAALEHLENAPARLAAD